MSATEPTEFPARLAVFNTPEKSTGTDAPPSPLAASEHVRDATQPNSVLLNVYDIMSGNSFLSSIGWGMHHVGVQVYGREYQYGYCEVGKGVGAVAPRHSSQHIFRESYYLGQTPLNAAAVAEVVEAFSELDEWLGSHYHIVQHNCIDFAHALCEALLPAAARVAQYRVAESVGVEKSRMEVVEVEGMRYAVPVLIPPHVDRLCRHAARFLPRGALERLEAADLPLASVSEALQPQPQPQEKPPGQPQRQGDTGGRASRPPSAKK